MGTTVTTITTSTRCFIVSFVIVVFFVVTGFKRMQV
jgi:hypothetical protein